jgi:hypothetical protein
LVELLGWALAPAALAARTSAMAAVVRYLIENAPFQRNQAAPISPAKLLQAP